MEPGKTNRPNVLLWYKIEDGKEFFIMDRTGYIAVRDYILTMEGSLDFAIQEISESNRLQTQVLGGK